MNIQQSKEEVGIIISDIISLCKKASGFLPFDRRRLKNKVYYEKLVDLFNSIHNCRVLENPSANTILTCALTLIPENYLGKKDELVLPYTVYFHLYRDFKVRLEPEQSEYKNRVWDTKDLVESYEVVLLLMQKFIEKYQLLEK